MGTSYSYACSNCRYSAESSGKKDWGLRAVVEPYTCEDCKELVDVIVGEYGRTYDPAEVATDDEYYTCPKCNGRNIHLWDIKRRPCPNCEQGKLDKDGSIITMWD